MEGCNVGEHRFTAPIESDGSGAWVTVPFDVGATFGAKRVPVSATIDGIAYRGSLVRMGGDCHALGILKAIRTQLGKGVGDTVEVVLERDDSVREVEVPADLASALAEHAGANEAFSALSYSHRREYVRWIEEAKRPETRARRVSSAIERLTGRGK
jgi:hypothetical protein